MGKRLFLLIIASLMGVMVTPEFLTAADAVELTGVDGIGVVETVPLPEPEPEPEVVEPAAPAAGYEYVAPVPQVVNYTVTVQVGSEQDYVNLARSLSYGDIYKFQKLVYAHNSSNLLGNLIYRQEGELITITEGAMAQTYRVTKIDRYEKTADGNLNGDATLMRNIAYNAMGHDAALMTCDFGGQSPANYPPGDAPYRLVLYADLLVDSA